MNIFKASAVTIIAVMFISLNAHSQPSVSGVSGTIVHGGTVTITGSGFGTKNPARPMIWADFENGNLNSTALGNITASNSDNRWGDGGSFTTAGQNINSTGSFRGQVGAANVGLGFNLSDSDPNYPGISKIYVFCKRKYDDPNYWYSQNHVTGTSTGNNTANTLINTNANWGSNYYSGRTVTITAGTGAGQTATIVNNSSNTLNLSTSWVTIPDNTSVYDINSRVNYKFFRLYTKPMGQSSNYPNTIYYYGDGNPPRLYSNTEGGEGTSCNGSIPVASSYTNSAWPPPTKIWSTEEYAAIRASATGVIKMWRDGALILDYGNINTSNPACYFTPYTDNWHGISIENFPTRALPPAGSYVYMDDIYVDNTWSRVMIGDQNTFETCAHREIQIPSDWSDTAATVTINRGSFANGSFVYLYVVDSDGNVNANGYPITIVSTLTPADTTAPAKPKGLRMKRQ